MKKISILRGPIREECKKLPGKNVYEHKVNEVHTQVLGTIASGIPVIIEIPEKCCDGFTHAWQYIPNSNTKIYFSAGCSWNRQEVLRNNFSSRGKKDNQRIPVEHGPKGLWLETESGLLVPSALGGVYSVMKGKEFFDKLHDGMSVRDLYQLINEEFFKKLKTNDFWLYDNGGISKPKVEPKDYILLQNKVNKVLTDLI